MKLMFDKNKACIIPLGDCVFGFCHTAISALVGQACSGFEISAS